MDGPSLWGRPRPHRQRNDQAEACAVFQARIWTRVRIRGRERPSPAIPSGLEEAHRVRRDPVDPHLEMKVGTEAVAGATDVSDDLALIDAARRDREGGLMGVASGDAAAVIDAGVVAVAAALRLGLVEDDRPGLGGADRSSGRDRDVDAGVQLAPAHPERGDDRTVDRPDEAVGGILDGAGWKRGDTAVGEGRRGE